MSLSRRKRHAGARLVLFIFLCAAAFGLVLVPSVSQAGRPASPVWRHTVNSAFAQLALDPPSWSANVRANTDTTTNGQHEPSLAVSPANPNVVVVANKDYRDQN